MEGALVNLLTVIVTTSPVQSHPCTSMLESVLASLYLVPGLDVVQKLIICDGYGQSIMSAYGRRCSLLFYQVSCGRSR
jgi:hypothetical protein